MIKNKISIGWFANTFVGRKSSGTARVGLNLVEGMIKKFSNDLDFYLICDSYTNMAEVYANPYLSKMKIVVLPPLRIKKFRSIRQFFRAKLVLKQEIDIVHFLVPRQYPFYFKFPANKFISTYHAGGDITAPVDTFVFSRFVYNIVGKYQNRYLTKIVADSEIAKIEIENAYSIQGARVDVIHLGSDHLWELPDIGRLESDNYILIVGRWQKYKNVHKILDAISSNEFFYKDYYKIILIGSNETDGRDLVLNEINKFSIEQIKCLTFVTEEELKSYYKYANLVIHPSINEGFGWPAFEAFGEGAPLLIHDQTPAGNLLKNNLGVTSCNLLGTTDSIHNSIQKALKINVIDLNERRKIIINMDCTWDKMVQNYYQLYLKVLRA